MTDANFISSPAGVIAASLDAQTKILEVGVFYGKGS